jgi:hypothetical protein
MSESFSALQKMVAEKTVVKKSFLVFWYQSEHELKKFLSKKRNLNSSVQ